MSLVAIDQSCSLIFTLPVVKCAPICPNPFAHSVYGKWPGLSGHNTLCIYGLSKPIGFVNNGHRTLLHMYPFGSNLEELKNRSDASVVCTLGEDIRGVG